MPFYFPGFLVSRVLAQRKLTDPNEVNRTALIGGLLGPSPAGLLITTTLVDRAAAANAPAPAPTEPPPISVPYVVGKTFVEAQENLNEVGLTAERRDVISDKPNDVVTAQNPKAETTIQKRPIDLDVSIGRPRRTTGQVVIDPATLSNLKQLIEQAEAQRNDPTAASEG